MTLVRRYDCPARRSSRAAPCRGVFQRLTAHAAHPAVKGPRVHGHASWRPCVTRNLDGVEPCPVASECHLKTRQFQSMLYVVHVPPNISTIQDHALWCPCVT